jgi:hypothetical protein
VHDVEFRSTEQVVGDEHVAVAFFTGTGIGRRQGLELWP